MAATPDISGFIDAQAELREQFGNEIVFSVPQTPSWPLGTRINPDTGEPYDAMAVRTNAAFQTVTITALTILKEASPLRPQADTKFAEAGVMSGMDIILDIAEADYAVVQAASEFAYSGKHYRVEEFKPFTVGNQRYRWLCYGQER